MASPCEDLQASSSRSKSISSTMNSKGTREPSSLTIGLLRKITDNFSEERIIGQGASGKVYRGVDDTGEEIAVKLFHNSMQAIMNEEFQNEYDNLMMLQHPNIVRLVGYCYETQRKFVEFEGRIVFGETTYRAHCSEYMHRGSLQRHLSDEFYGLDWKTRYKIMKGACEGLRYLHEEFREPIYHLDLKPDNILLDENMTPKLADIGLSKLFSEYQAGVTHSPIGTIGYMPPEYLSQCIVSKKFDIFSLGVVITKIIAGPNGNTRSAEMTYHDFLDQIHENWRNRLEVTCTSSRILEAYCEQVSICIEIGLMSMQEDRHKRPNIVDIIDKLDQTETNIQKAILLSANSRSSMSVKSQREDNLVSEPCRRVEVMPRAGVDVVVILNVRMNDVKEIMIMLVDRLSSHDRISILFPRILKQNVMELTYMSDHSRAVVRLKISELAHNKVQIYNEYEASALQEAAQILRQRGEEEINSRTCCIMHVWTGQMHHEIPIQDISPEFPVHTIALSNHEPGGLKNVEDMISGTYSFVNSRNLDNIKYAFDLFIARITMVAARSVRITVQDDDESRLAREETLFDLCKDSDTLRARHGDEMEVSWLNCHEWQRATTKCTSTMSGAFQIIEQHAHVHASLVEMKGFTRSKGIIGSETCDEFPVLVQITAAPWCHAGEMPCDGMDIVVVLDFSRNMQVERLERLKQAMMTVIDKLGLNDWLSIMLLQIGGADQAREEITFRVMFNTAFITSNILMINRGESDVIGDAKDRYLDEFLPEVTVSEMDSANQLDSRKAEDEGKEVLPVEVLEVEKMFSTMDWTNPRDAAVKFSQRPTSSENMQFPLPQGFVSPSKNGSTVKKVTEQMEIGSCSLTDIDSDDALNLFLEGILPVRKGTPPPPPQPPPPRPQQSVPIMLGASNSVIMLKSKNSSQSSEKNSGHSPLLHSSPRHPPPPNAPRFSPVISSEQPSLPSPAPAFGYCSRDNTISNNLQKATSLTMGRLQEITENFSIKRKIGQGAFGRVYMGMFESGKKIAVKMLYNNNPGIDDEQFQREFGNLMMLEHENIVQLVGYCYETQHEPMRYKGRTIFAEKIYRALCFEYMQNGSLKSYLSDECDGLTWDERRKIIRGICEGLRYLHEGSGEPIYHLDLKPDNILLDKNMVPKLADFGLSRLCGDELTRITQSPIGTMGYLPTEYLHGQIVSNKLDIFSLGVVMIKIIAGPESHTRSVDMSPPKFLNQVHENWRKRLLQQMLCSSQSVDTYCQQVKICTKIALSCMVNDRNERPTIADIINQLNKMPL